VAVRSARSAHMETLQLTTQRRSGCVEELRVDWLDG
jgi:hypothetical protein